MSYKIVVLCVFVLLFLVVIYRGDRKVKARKKIDERMVEIYGEMSEVFDDVAYQGGFPPMPKPARLNLGVTESALVLYDHDGNNGLIEYEKIRKLDRFVTKHDRKRKFSLMAYGPLALVLNRPSFRHFFTMDYIDVNNERNNILVLVRNREIAENLYQSVLPYVKRKNKK
jgi:hypothetical protein